MLVTQNEIRTRFRRHGLRVTPQRLAIYQTLANTTAHPTAERLLTAVRRTLPRVSVNTIYYTLAALRKVGLVHEVNYGHERARFDANLEPHHHVICRDCGRIIDLLDEALDQFPLQAAMPARFMVTSHRVDIFGYCADCRSRHRRNGTQRLSSRPTRR